MEPAPPSPAYDAIIIGAGPTGLTAATYLGRFRRRVLVLDGGPSRAAWIPESHNTPGFPHGVGGEELLARLRDQAQTYGAVIQEGLAQRLEIASEGFCIETTDGRLETPTVLLATGVIDRLPPLEGVDAAIHAGRVRMCPICDAYEATGARIAILGDGDLAHREADFLRDYSTDITVLSTQSGQSRDATVIRLDDLHLEDEQVVVARPEGPDLSFDYLYLALGCSAQVDLAAAVGARQDETGKLLVDDHQMTTVAGLYAAGDVVRGLNQIAVGAGEAAIAATAIHNRLRRA